MWLCGARVVRMRARAFAQECTRKRAIVWRAWQDARLLREHDRRQPSVDAEPAIQSGVSGCSTAPLMLRLYELRCCGVDCGQGLEPVQQPALRHHSVDPGHLSGTQVCRLCCGCAVTRSCITHAFPDVWSRFLNLYTNRLSGTVPAALGSLTRLQYDRHGRRCVLRCVIW